MQEPAHASCPRYDAVAVWLHWIVSIAILIQLALGWWMLDLPKSPAGVRAGWFNVHKSIGLTIAAVVVVRLAWRVRNRRHRETDPLPAWQRGAANAVHGALYACMLVLPLSGYLGSSFSGYPVKLWGMTLPAWASAWPAAKDFMSAVHETAVWTLMVLSALHIAAALAHLVRRDGVFARMWA
jgi:cytochrome b561